MLHKRPAWGPLEARLPREGATNAATKPLAWVKGCPIPQSGLCTLFLSAFCINFIIESGAAQQRAALTLQVRPTVRLLWQTGWRSAERGDADEDEIWGTATASSDRDSRNPYNSQSSGGRIFLCLLASLYMETGRFGQRGIDRCLGGSAVRRR